MLRVYSLPSPVSIPQMRCTACRGANQHSNNGIRTSAAPVRKVVDEPKRSHSQPPSQPATNMQWPQARLNTPKAAPRTVKGAVSVTMAARLPCVKPICAPHDDTDEHRNDGPSRSKQQIGQEWLRKCGQPVARQQESFAPPEIVAERSAKQLDDLGSCLRRAFEQAERYN